MLQILLPAMWLVMVKGLDMSALSKLGHNQPVIYRQLLHTEAGARMETPAQYALKIDSGAICNCSRKPATIRCKRHRQIEAVIADAIASALAAARADALEEAAKVADTFNSVLPAYEGQQSTENAAEIAAEIRRRAGEGK